MSFGQMIFGEMNFGELIFGEMNFGELIFGEMNFGEMITTSTKVYHNPTNALIISWNGVSFIFFDSRYNMHRLFN